MNGTVLGIGLSGLGNVQRAAVSIMFPSHARLQEIQVEQAGDKIMKWIPKNGSWWRKAVLKAGGDADRIRIRPEEQDWQLAHLRLHKAIAATEILKCRAIMAAEKITA